MIEDYKLKTTHNRIYIMRNIILLICLSVPLFAISECQTDDPDALNVLYLTGGGWHDYEAQAEGLTTELSSQLNINWTINHEAGNDNNYKHEFYSDPDWHLAYDAVIYNMCFADVTDTDYIESITSAHAESGTAALFIHCAMHSFRDAETDAWDQLVGLETYHHEHEQREFEIIAVDTEHPIMAGFPEDNWISPQDELYIITAEHENLIPLATAYGPETETEHVVMWANTYGNARIVGTTAGHNTDVIIDPVFVDFIANGLIWSTQD